MALPSGIIRLSNQDAKGELTIVINISLWLTRDQVAHQSNLFDCGVYVIETARCLAASIDPQERLSQVTASQLREEYTRAIADNHMGAGALGAKER